MHLLLSQPGTWVVLTMLGAAAVSDLRSGLIPDALPLLGAAGGVLAQLVAAGFGHTTFAAALGSMALGVVVCSVGPGVLFALGALGGGDLKLFVATGLCLGPALGLDIQLGAHLLAAACLPLHVLRHGGARRTLATLAALLSNPFLPAARRTPIDRAQLTSMRFAPAIFAAALWVFSFGSVVP